VALSRSRILPRFLLTCGLTLWSFAQLLVGLVQSFGQFFGARVLLGVGEAPQFPTGARVVRDWFNPRDRGLATGVFNCASSLGTAIAVPLLTFLMLSFGWRVEAVVPLPDHLGHDPRLFRLHLSLVDLYRLAPRLS
jgi:MFS family permease